MMALKYYCITKTDKDVNVSRIRNVSDSLLEKLTTEHPVAFCKIGTIHEPAFCVMARNSADAINKYECYMDDVRRKFKNWRER